ncbi:MAG: YihY/virulence factor BrkB family protein [Bacteroidetes bacterium]|nr:YihY/virulence factor BrkB family protein [Bacteroidota bacterium]
MRSIFQSLKGRLDVVSFYLRSLLHRSHSDDIFFYASSLSFQVMLCLIPTIFLVIWVLGSFLSRGTILKQLEVISFYAIPERIRSVEEIRRVFLERAEVFTRHAGLFGILSFAGFFWTALALVSTLRKTVFHILSIEVRQSFLRQTLYDLRMLLIAGFFLTASIAVTATFTGLREVALQLPQGHMRFALIKFGVPILSGLGLTFLLYFSIYRFLSFGKIRSASAAFGAFWAAILFESAKNVFAMYISRIGNLGEVYGTMEVLIGLLLWVFYSTSVFILGVEFSNIHSMRRGAV